ALNRQQASEPRPEANHKRREASVVVFARCAGGWASAPPAAGLMLHYPSLDYPVKPGNDNRKNSLRAAPALASPQQGHMSGVLRQIKHSVIFARA
ncbi:MAG: hypothetical protein FWD15_05485, partial [Alphaproteobacteria bacterium]|nr:hypothetical protein [Alphaproteobacteria bacterium]